MGIRNMFEPGADFTGISDAPLLVSEIVQKATIDVDESGSEAAAATGEEFITYSVRIATVVRLDRPFIFTIDNHKTRSIMYMGKIINPMQI
ncbi:hypothetical protein GN956_G26875 [Arapaima gigas]